MEQRRLGGESWHYGRGRLRDGPGPSLVGIVPYHEAAGTNMLAGDMELSLLGLLRSRAEEVGELEEERSSLSG